METILLNTDYTYLANISWKRAVCLVVKGKVEVIKYAEKVIKNFDGSFIMKVPIVIKLVKIIRILYKTKVPFSKKNVIIRDEFTCGYCGKKGGNLTIDHIVPRSRMGKTNFENCVASCKECNHKKGNLTPSEANMYLKHKPTQPTIQEFLSLKIKNNGINNLLRELGVY